MFLLIADWKWRGRRSVCLWPGSHRISYPGCSDRRKPGCTCQSRRDLPSKERGVSESLKYLLDFWQNMLDIKDKLCFLSCFQGVTHQQWYLFNDFLIEPIDKVKISNIRKIPTYPIMKRPHVYSHSEFCKCVICDPELCCYNVSPLGRISSVWCELEASCCTLLRQEELPSQVRFAKYVIIHLTEWTFGLLTKML